MLYREMAGMEDEAKRVGRRDDGVQEEQERAMGLDELSAQSLGPLAVSGHTGMGHCEIAEDHEKYCSDAATSSWSSVHRK